MRLYYLIWVDCIKRGISQNGNNRDTLLNAMVFMSISMTLNFALFMTILQGNILHNYFYDIDLSFFSFLTKHWANAVSFVILFVLPCVTINYLLIFRNNRYKKLLKKYPYYD